MPLIPYGGLAKGANDGLPPELLAVSPTNPANLGAALPIDEQFWRDNQDKLTPAVQCLAGALSPTRAGCLILAHRPRRLVMAEAVRRR